MSHFPEGLQATFPLSQDTGVTPLPHVSMHCWTGALRQVSEHDVAPVQSIEHPVASVHCASQAPEVHVVKHPAEVLLHVEPQPEARQMMPHEPPVAHAPSAAAPSPTSLPLKRESKSWVQPTTQTASTMHVASQCLTATRHLPVAWVAWCMPLAPRRSGVRVCLAAAMCASLTMGAAVAGAQTEKSVETAAMGEAKQLFRRGSALFRQGNYADALPMLRQSFDLVPSPNSELLIARCLRHLGRLVESQDAFAHTEAGARDRIAAGEAKYANTAESAATEGAEVRADLGSIHLVVDRAIAPGAALEVDGVVTAVPPGGDVRIWHLPGSALVTLRPATGATQRETVDVRSGAESDVRFVPVVPPAPEVPRAPTGAPETAPPANVATPSQQAPLAAAAAKRSGRPSWSVPAAIVSGSMTAAGAGVFIGFGLESQKIFGDLRRQCGTTCGTSAEHALANTGKQDQLIANVALGVGAAAAAATAVFTVVALLRPPGPRGGGVTLRLRVGPLEAGLAGDF